MGSQAFSDALGKVLAAGKSAGIPVGIFGLNPENAAQLMARGFDFLQCINRYHALLSCDTTGKSNLPQLTRKPLAKPNCESETMKK